MMWAGVWETRVRVTTANVYWLDFSLLSILCYITCLHPHTCVCTGILPLYEISIRALWAYSWFGRFVVHPQVLSWTNRRYLWLRVTWAEAGDRERPGAAVIYSVIEPIVRETELFRELSDCIVLSDVLVRERLESVSDYIAYVCIFILYCRVVYVMYFIQYSQCTYIWCIFSYHCFLWMASTVLYCWILYLSVAALLIMTSIVLHRTWGVTSLHHGVH